jgi:hydrogenase maturation protein HypF
LNKRFHIHIDGVVQGVGFRPFIYRIATKYNFTGFVYNHSKGVEVEIQGQLNDIESFIKDVHEKKPPLSQIVNLNYEEVSTKNDEEQFRIIESVKGKSANTLLPPDIATCNECIKELFDPKDRRYRYPFINCMNCGPRYTIIHSIPYDRKNTTMNVFPLCEECQQEYEDPQFRRFHAEPNACEVCGPALSLIDANGDTIPCDDVINKSVELLKKGYIVAVKSLGGFHLACDGENYDAVQKLRERKKRPDKPFAVMSFDLKEVKKYCIVDEEKETRLLQSPQRPIALLRKRSDSQILAQNISPNNNYLGVMIAYNPIQLLLIKDNFTALVMTSGNVSDEPICTENEEALEKLNGIADAFLIHNRGINTRIDDSIAFVENNQTFLIRRARGYVPQPILYKDKLKPILGTGPELKNTIALSRDKSVFVSQHIGDLKNVENYEFYLDTVKYLSGLLDLSYDTVACDLHPDYLSTQYAQSLKKEGCKLIPIQHHKAHIGSCIAENGLDPDVKVIGVAFDGTGYGEDGTIWGGEFFTGNLYDFHRSGYIKPVRIAGGEKATEEPYRIAISYLVEYLGEVPKDIPFYEKHKDNIPFITSALKRGINAPLSSSCGRLFDAISSLIGIRDYITFEGQGAIDMQMTSESKLSLIDDVKHYTMISEKGNGVWLINPENLISEVISDIKNKKDIGIMGIKFHKALCISIADICKKLSYENNTNIVILSGGVFQNRLLISYLIPLLESEGFSVFTHKLLPPNDACISLGQIMIANYYVE